MSGERSLNNIRGWREVWNTDEAKIKSAIRKVRRLTGLTPDGFEGVSFSTRKETRYDWITDYSVVGLEPSQAELESTPKPLRKMLVDLGIKPKDRVALEFSSSLFEFDFTVKPEEITEDRVGITLSTTPFRAAVIALLKSHYSFEDGKVVANSFSLGVKGHPYCFLKGARVSEITDSYGYIYRNIQSNDPKSWHPDMVEILSRAANWGTTLVASRRKTLL